MQDICYLISIAHLPVPVFLWKITEISENKTTVSPTYINYFDPAERLYITALFQTEHLILKNVGQPEDLTFSVFGHIPPRLIRSVKKVHYVNCTVYSTATCTHAFPGFEIFIKE